MNRKGYAILFGCLLIIFLSHLVYGARGSFFESEKGALSYKDEEFDATIFDKETKMGVKNLQKILKNLQQRKLPPIIMSSFNNLISSYKKERGALREFLIKIQEIKKSGLSEEKQNKRIFTLFAPVEKIRKKITALTKLIIKESKTALGTHYLLFNYFSFDYYTGLRKEALEDLVAYLQIKESPVIKLDASMPAEEVELKEEYGSQSVEIAPQMKESARIRPSAQTEPSIPQKTQEEEEAESLGMTVKEMREGKERLREADARNMAAKKARTKHEARAKERAEALEAQLEAERLKKENEQWRGEDLRASPPRPGMIVWIKILGGSGNYWRTSIVEGANAVMIGRKSDEDAIPYIIENIKSGKYENVPAFIWGWGPPLLDDPEVSSSYGSIPWIEEFMIWAPQNTPPPSRLFTRGK